MARKRAKKKLSQTPAARRARRRDRDPLYNPAVQLSGNRLAQAASTLTDLEFRPREQALEGRLKTATTQGTALAGRAGDYYRNLATDAAQRVAQQQALRDRLQGSLAGIAAGGQAKIDQAQTEAGATAAADRDLRGAGLSGGGDEKVANELALRRATAGTAAQAYQSDAAAQSGNYEGLTNALGGTRALRGGEVQGELLNRLAAEQSGIRDQQTESTSQRGATQTKHLLDLRQSGFENAATAEGLGLDQKKIAAQLAQDETAAEAAARRQSEAERHNRAGEGTAAQNASTSAAAQREAARHNVAQENKEAAKKKKPTPQSVYRGRQAIDQARSQFQHYKGDYQKYTRSAIRNGVPSAIFHAGYELEHQGYIGPNTVRALKAIGITVPSGWRRAPAVSPRAVRGLPD